MIAGLLLTEEASRRHVFDPHDPLIVAIATAEDPNGLCRALTCDTSHRPCEHCAATRAHRTGWCARKPRLPEVIVRAKARTEARPLLRPRGARKARLLRPGQDLPAIGDALLAGARRADDFARRKQPEFPILRERILVLLSKELLCHQDVDVRRPAASELAAPELDRARILARAPDELRFFLALGLVPPHRHRHGHKDAHDRNRDQQGRHRVPMLAREATCGLTL